MTSKTSKTVMYRYRSKLKYIRVDFYLKDSDLWNYIEYLREQGVSTAGMLREYLRNLMNNDENYKNFLNNK